MESLSVALVSLASVVLVLRQTDATVPLAATFGLVVYVVGTVVLKLGKALIYPFYISKLRHLPGPKVWQINVFMIGGGRLPENTSARERKKGES